MRSVSLLSALAAVTAVQAGAVKPRQTKITPVTAKGNAFYVGNQRFYVRGVDYQPGGSSANLDPLADPDVCKPDIEKFIKLGINVIRVYSTDNAKDHTECMNLLADAGIYVVLDANNPLYSINREKPAPSYNAEYLQSVFATIDEFAKYDNTMAFFSGNEVIHDLVETTRAARFVKAVTRDMRQYIRTRFNRQILVGYSAADVQENRMQTAAYFNCGPDDERSDFFAFNDYSWCTSNFITSGWDKKVQNFTDYGLPIFLSEYGCIQNVRDFGELESLMHSNMTSVYSGGLMYEYTYEENKYGIVTIDDKAQKGPRKELPEFANFAKAMKDFPAPAGDGGASPTTHSQPCPTKDAHWDVDSTLLPAMPEGAKKYLTDGAGKGPGLNGPGSQNSGPAEVEDAAPGSGAGGGNGNTNKNAATKGRMDNASLFVSGAVLVATLMGAVAL
ncbi:Glucanosyltransferase-domain-containing protein [Immersiella caudata]|uniref:1,3-beta-glucanosyltransferase n=1 Tax=Immersiella caudata TaxID=314043 RepID=A0AA40C0N9_9PEZI|nr:Glucanosyltransferase-domain-containing protein [Immersiella caudata]